MIAHKTYNFNQNGVKKMISHKTYNQKDVKTAIYYNFY